MMTDPIADMLTRVRNALLVEKPQVDIPLSKLKRAVADVLQREGFIWDSQVVEGEPFSTLRLNLKYGSNGERVIQKIDRVSEPGRRQYSSIEDLKPLRGGMGIYILSTSQGVLSDREAREKNVGGEVLCSVY